MTADPLDLQAVLFDMDGTLFDSEQLWDISLAELATRLGGALSPELRRHVTGGNLTNTVRLIHAELGSDTDEAESAIWLLERTRQLFAEGVPWRPGARELVEAVSAAGLPAALVTSSYRILTDAVADQLPDGAFRVVICGDEVAHAKPDPEPYTLAAVQLGVDPRRCVALEDSANGIASAAAAGCVAVAVGDETESLTLDPGVVPADLRSVSVDRLRRLVNDRLVSAPHPGGPA